MSHIPARTFNRRTFAKGVGWAAPAVVASAAVPAYASSVCETKPPLKFDEKNRWVFQNTGSANLYSRDGFRAITYNKSFSHLYQLWITISPVRINLR